MKVMEKLRRNGRMRDAVGRAKRRDVRIGRGDTMDFGLLCVDEGIRMGLAMAMDAQDRTRRPASHRGPESPSTGSDPK